MKEYIEREAAIKEVAKWLADVFGIKSESGAGTLFKKLRSIPAADVVEVRTGEWIFGVTMHHEWMKCSVCNVSQDPNGCFSYCPNCGAKMDGGADDGKAD